LTCPSIWPLLQADENALHYVTLHGSRTQIGEEEQAYDKNDTYHADDDYKTCVGFAHVVIVIKKMI
jgi:hypothetical protein